MFLTGSRRSFPIASRLFLLAAFVFTCSNLALAQKSKKQKVTTTELVAEVEPQADPANWKTFTSAAGNFSIVTPGTFTHEEKTTQGPDGPVQLHVFIYYANAEYSVTYADYLAVIENSDRTQLFLNAVRDAGVQGINGRLVEEKEITLEGHPGRTYIIEYGTNNGFLLAGRNIVVGQRLYILSATYRKNEVPLVKGSYADWALKFLDSFKLTKTSATAGLH